MVREPLGKPTGTDAFCNALLQAMPATLCQVSPKFEMMFINRLPRGQKMEQILGRSVFDFIVPEDRGRARACFERVAASRQTDGYEARTQDGKIFDVTVAPMDTPDGEHAFCTVSVEVTGIREKEIELKKKQAQVHLAMEAFGIGFGTYDVATGQSVWDARLKEIYGRDEEMSSERWMNEMVHPDDRAKMQARAQRAYSTDIFETATWRLVWPDGTVHWVLGAGVIVRNAQGEITHTIGGSMDFTEQHGLEQKLRVAHRNEAISNITAGVAHNFNNLLAAIMPSIELALDDVSPDLQELLQDARHACLRGAAMVRKLQAFGGHRTAKKRSFCLVSALVDEATKACAGNFGGACQVTSVGDAQLEVLCDRIEITRVVAELLENAHDALQRSQTETPKVSIGFEVVQQSDCDWVQIRVRDNADGLSEVEALRVFEPFFTTKATTGSGLGLSTARAVVQDHGGELIVTSTSGHGACFELTLPVTVHAP